MNQAPSVVDGWWCCLCGWGEGGIAMRDPLEDSTEPPTDVSLSCASARLKAAPGDRHGRVRKYVGVHAHWWLLWLSVRVRAVITVRFHM